MFLNINKEMMFYIFIIDIIIFWGYKFIVEFKFVVVWKLFVGFQKIIVVKEDLGLERVFGIMFYVCGGFEIYL